MDIGKILLTLSYVKYKQFDFSWLVNGKSIKGEVHFPQYYKNCWESQTQCGPNTSYFLDKQLINKQTINPCPVECEKGAPFVNYREKSPTLLGAINNKGTTYCSVCK